MFASLHVRRYIPLLYPPNQPPTTIGPLFVEIILGSKRVNGNGGPKVQ